MKNSWKLQDAKAHFSQVVQDALKKGPQYVTLRGTQAVVIISVEQYNKSRSHKKSFRDFLLHCPRLDEGLPVERQKDLPRSIDL
jgi:prevent-host-death family protein